MSGGQKPETRILHVATFSGNIGDNASHTGLYRSLAQSTGWNIKVTEREIRKAYMNYDGDDGWQWDASFVDQVNNHDLTIIGGGNYFELWIESSATGTTVDMEVELLKQLKRPMVFHGIGCDPCKGYTKETLAKFRTFLDAVCSHPMCLVAVRNDGSKNHILDLLGQSLADAVLKTPDPGFFIEPPTIPVPMNVTGRYWAINIAADIKEIRFPGGSGMLDYSEFINNMRHLAVMSLTTYPDLEWVLVPHIFSDLDAIRDFMHALPEYLRRHRVTVAPLLHGSNAEKYSISVYANAELVLGTRFHTNVCSIGLGVPTIGLITYAKLESLYDDLEMPERAVWANRPGFVEKVNILLKTTMNDLSLIRRKYECILKSLLQDARQVHCVVKSLVLSNNQRH